MAARGLSLDAHRSRMVSQDLLTPFKLILTMEEGHKESLQVEFLQIQNRVFLLSEVAGSSGPVKDPYGLPLDYYQATAREIVTLLEKGMENIVRLTSA